MIEVCAAVVVRVPEPTGGGPLVLVARRTRPADLAGLWEFPGGKLESGESAADCLVREFIEELGLAIAVGDELAASERGGRAPLRLTSYAARLTCATDEPVLLDGTHDEVRWVSAVELQELAERQSLAPLDIPLVASAVDYLARCTPC